MTEYAWRPPAINGGWEDVLRRQFIYPTDVEPFGPMGLRCKITTGGAVHTPGSIIVTQAAHDDDGIEWLHASIAWRDRDPSYAELAILFRAVFGRRRFAYQVFAPESEHVNIHEHALHLWGHVNGERLTPRVEGTV